MYCKGMAYAICLRRFDSAGVFAAVSYPRALVRADASQAALRSRLF